MGLALTLSLMHFSAPWGLAALVLAMVPGWLAWRARRRHLHPVPRAATILQTVALAAAAIALAGPQWPLDSKARLPYLVLDDISASVGGQTDRPLDLGAGVARQDFQFAAAVAPAVATASDAAWRDRTNLAPALQLAAAKADQSAGVIIRTDGQFQDEDWPAAAEALARTKAAVAIVPLDAPPADARIADLSAARQSGQAVDVSVTVAANARQRRTLKLWREDLADGPLLLRKLDLEPNAPATIHARDQFPLDRTAVYRAELSPADAFAQNDSVSQVLPALARRIAIIQSATQGAVQLGAPPGIAMARLAPEGAPRDLAAWLDYGAVMLADAQGDLLAPAQRQALAQYVRGGGGLVLVGAGPHGSPQDRSDPLNQVAALVANPYERRPIKVIVILDASGSMAEAAGAGNSTKFSLAAQAVASLRQHLTPRDALEVITFSDRPHVVYDSHDGPPDFWALGDALATVRPTGPTRVQDALNLAAGTDLAGREGLVLLLSDLRTEDFDAAAMAGRLQRARLSLAVAVATGPNEPNEPKAAAPGRDATTASQPAIYPLQALAARMGAPLVVTSENLLDLSQVFARFLRQARGSAVRSGDFVVRAMPDAPPSGLSAAPHLTAYLLCAPQPNAQLLATVQSAAPNVSSAATTTATGTTSAAGTTVQGDPLIARREVGLGRSFSLAIPLGPSQNDAWRGWPGFGELLSSAVGWTLGPPADPRFAVRIDRTPGQVKLFVQGYDGLAPMNLLDLVARAQPLDGFASQTPGRLQASQPADGPGTSPATVSSETSSGPATPAEAAMRQVAPGQYEVQLPATAEAVALRIADRQGKVYWNGAAAPAVASEFAAIGPNGDNLRRLATLLGARIVSPAELTQLTQTWGQGQLTPLWPALALVALAAALLDWSLARRRRKAAQ